MSMAWLKDSRTIDTQSITITQVDQFNSMLAIESLSQEHNGNYSCIARNAAAEVSDTTQLFVNGNNLQAARGTMQERFFISMLVFSFILI